MCRTEKKIGSLSVRCRTEIKSTKIQLGKETVMEFSLLFSERLQAFFLEMFQVIIKLKKNKQTKKKNKRQIANPQSENTQNSLMITACVSTGAMRSI